MKKTFICYHLFIFFFLLLSHPASGGQRPVKIGVLAMRGMDKAVKSWGPTAEYLTQNIPGYSFSIVPLAFEEVYAAVREDKIDFLLANTGMFVDLEYIYRSVHNVMRELKTGPYKTLGEFALMDILRQYAYCIIGALAAVAVLIAFTLRVSRLNRKIEQELRTRILAEEELREAKEQAEEATKLKDKFVSLVAHDLKAPLFAITGFMSLILKDRDNQLHKEHREMAEQAHEAGTRLFRMIEGLLNISRLQTGKLVPQKRFFDGRWTSAAVIESMKLLAGEKGIELANKVPRGTRLYADMDLFRQVLQNLVSNSIKFCGKGDTITLYVPHGENATIAVIDTGVGISDRTLPDIFKHEEPTSTLGTAGERGTGLGLPLSHDIMKAHDGTLSAASIKGEGTVFYAQLPYVKPEILIVGADGELRLLLKEAEEMNEMNIIDAKGVEEAIKFLDEQIPHLVLMDLEMSRMNGLDLLERISGDTRTKEIPVIVITGDSNMEARQKAFQLGAGDFAVKPLVSADLIPRIRRFVG